MKQGGGKTFEYWMPPQGEYEHTHTLDWLIMPGIFLAFVRSRFIFNKITYISIFFPIIQCFILTKYFQADGLHNYAVLIYPVYSPDLI